MASHPASNPAHSQQQPHAAPYCSDPDCEYCKALHHIQELIRLHESSSGSPPQRNTDAIGSDAIDSDGDP
jgi:hypothetical protein